MMKRTATALILTLGLAGLTQTAVQADDKSEKLLAERVTRLEQQLTRIENLLSAPGALNASPAAQPIQQVAATGSPATFGPAAGSNPAAFLAAMAAAGHVSSKASLPTIEDMKKKYIKKIEEAEQKRLLGCFLKDLLDCADDCPSDKCKKPTVEPASWIYYSAPRKKNCVIKEVLGF